MSCVFVILLTCMEVKHGNEVMLLFSYYLSY